MKPIRAMNQKLVVCLILVWVFWIMEKYAAHVVKQIMVAPVILDITD
jgi:hypothetical protein